MKRWLLIGGGVVATLVVVVVVVAVFVVSNLGSLIKAGVEEVGPRVTQTTVRLDDVDISARSGSGTLRGLTVGNPAGFETPSIFALGEVSVSIDVGTITSDTIVIREIVIAAPAVTYEIGADGSNIDALRRNVEQALGGGAADASQGGGAKSERKLVVESLTMRDGQISVSATGLGGRTLTVPLPEIHLADLGKDTNGAEPAVIIDQVVRAVLQHVGPAVAGLDIEGVLGKAAKEVEGASGELEGALKDTVEGAGERLKGLLGNN